MKTEIMKIPGKGVCIVISDIDPRDFFNQEHITPSKNGIFTDIYSIANEIKENRKISAIKKIREQTGWTLRKSKDYIDNYLLGNVADRRVFMECHEAANQFVEDHLPKDFINKDEFEV